MPLLVTCNVCGYRLRLPDEASGTQVKCPVCGHVVPVPDAPQPTPRTRRGSLGAARIPRSAGWEVYSSVAGSAYWPWLVGAGATIAVVLLLALLFLVMPPRRKGAASGAPSTPPPEAAARNLAAAAAARPAAARPAPPTRTPLPARPAPVARAQARVEPPAPKAVGQPGFPLGPLEGAVRDRAERVILAMMRRAMGAGVIGTRRIATGTKLVATLDDTRYEGTAFGDFTLRGLGADRVSTDKCYVMAANPWPLSDDVTVPAGTHVIYGPDRLDVVSMAQLKAQARARNEYVARTIKLLRESTEQEDWPRARALLSESLGKYPDEQQLLRWQREVDRQSRIASITIINRSQLTLRLRLLQGSRVVESARLVAGRRMRFRIPAGVYTGRYAGSNEENPTTERVTVKANETWVIRTEYRHVSRSAPAIVTWYREVESRS